MQRSILFVVALLATLSDSIPFSNEWSHFQEFINDYEKPYNNDSGISTRKFEVFKESLKRHQRLNAIELERKGTAVYGVNKFSDLTQEEFKSMYLSPPRPPSPDPSLHEDSWDFSLSDIPKRFDWRQWNNMSVISSINNQKFCGSCWAFSVIETIESALAIETKSPPQKLSVQQLISCEYIKGKLDGCAGGDIYTAFNDIHQNKVVIVPDDVYPFTSSDGKTGSCKNGLPNTGVVVEDFKYYKTPNESSTMAGLVSSVSPTSNAVNAVLWQDYKEGIIQHHCNTKDLDHAIQVVGYSLENDPIPYWIIRNTWGSDWGENGYLRISLGHNTCGITDQVNAVNKVKKVYF